jgi:PKD repeat protein
LPSWATLNTTTGAITGTPQDSGSSTISLTATGPGGTSEATTATISIAVGPPIIVAGQSFTGKVGVAFTSATPTLDDALDRPATSWSVTGLPAGLSLNATTGAITGTPTAKGSFTASFEATGDGGTSEARSVAFTITAGVPIIAAGQTLSGVVGAAFSGTPALTDSSNRPVTSWAATGLPSWATLNATTGAITGTPQDSGSTTISLTATGPEGTDVKTATIAVVVALVVTWPGMNVRVGEVVSFFVVTGSLPGGMQSGVDYYVNAKLLGDKFTISATLGGAPVVPTSQTWTGTYKARLKSRACRGGTSDIQYIGLSPGEGAAWDSEAGSMMLWGYNANTSTATISRLLKAEDIEYADLSAMDWVISGVNPPPQDGTLRTERVVNHRLRDGVMLANWPSGGEVLVDLDGRSAVAVQEATLGELTIAPGYTRNLRIAMLSHLDGVPGWGNLCSLYIKFFATHASSGIDAYRRGGGDAWTEVLAFGPPSLAVSEASVPVTGAFAVYKLVRGPFDEGVVSVSLRMSLI